MTVSELVSVIIPTFNREVSILYRAVQSVLNQSYNKVEIIIVDDNDLSSEYGKNNMFHFKSMDKYNNIIFITNGRNMGVSYSRNQGIRHCHGEFVTFLDDDDEYEFDKVYNQLLFMKKYSLDMSFSELKVYDNNKVVDYREYHDIKSFKNDDLLRYHLTKQITGTPSFMFKRSAIIKIGGFDNYSMGEEFYLMLKAIESGLKIGYCPTCDIIVHHHNSNGLSTGSNKVIGENKLFEFKKQYFNRLSLSECKFIRFRHYAVLVVAYLKSRNYSLVVFYGVLAFCSSPGTFLREVLRFILKINKQNKGKENINEKSTTKSINNIP